jgi:hypothetical protein
MLKIIYHKAGSMNELQAISLANILNEKNIKFEMYTAIPTDKSNAFDFFKPKKNDIIINCDLKINSPIGLFAVKIYNKEAFHLNKIKKILFLFAKAILFNQMPNISLNSNKYKALSMAKKIFNLINPIIESSLLKFYKIKIVNLNSYDIPLRYDLEEIENVQIGHKKAIICDICDEFKTKELVEYAILKAGEVILYGRILDGAYFYESIEPLMKSGKVKFAGNIINFRKIYQDSNTIYVNNLYPLGIEIETQAKNLGIDVIVLNDQNSSNQKKKSINDLFRLWEK